MSGFAVKGWCPSALRPMPSGDGLVVRLRPRLARLSSAQAAGIAELSALYGNGLLDLTQRASLQIRGVSDASHGPLIEGLHRLGLVDAERKSKNQRNILVTPFWRDGDDSMSLASDLEAALARRSLDLPEKFGFAIDCGIARFLAQAPADIRIERGLDGGLIVRGDGAQRGRAVVKEQAIDAALALAEWFVASGGVKNGRGRMAAHLATTNLPADLSGDTLPAPVMPSSKPGLVAEGALVGLAFGQLGSEMLAHLGAQASGLRLTPWRMLLLENAREMPSHEGIITHADDPLLRAVACTGAPRCPEAHASTRDLAAALATLVPADTLLHVSGCTKGCAHPHSADLTLVGTPKGFALVRGGTARDVPVLQGLSAERILADPGALFRAR